MPVDGNPIIKSPERSFTLQKYLLLHSQHDALQCHLAALHSHQEPGRTTVPTSPTRSSFAKLASPESHMPPTAFASRPQLTKRRSSLPPMLPSTASTVETAEVIVEEDHREEQNIFALRHSSMSSAASSSESLTTLAEEERKLQDVNLQIKSTLTELLNCESVRHDAAYRAWIQRRLMEAEQELRGGRRGSLHHGFAGGPRRRSWEPADGKSVL